MEMLALTCANAAGTSIKFSHLLRAMTMWMMHGREHIEHEFQKTPGLVRPPNQDTLGLAEFETEIAAVLARALKSAPPMK